MNELGKYSTAASVAGLLGEAKVSTESIAAFAQEDVFDGMDVGIAVEAAKDLIVETDAVVSVEYDDNAPHMDPVVLTVAVSKQLSTAEDDVIGTWAPVKLIAKGDSAGVTIDMPYYLLTVYENGEQKDIKLSDLDIDGVSPDVGTPKVIPTWTTENQAYFEASTKRTGKESKFTGSYLVGKDIPLFVTSSEQRDLSGAAKGRSDVIRPGGRIGYLNMNITDGTDTEVMRLDLDALTSKDNIFVDPTTGKKKDEKLSATIYVPIEVNSQVIVDASSMSTGTSKDSALIPPTLAANEIIVLAINVEAINDRKDNVMKVKSVTVDFEKSAINGVFTPVSTTHGIRGLSFSVTSYEPVLFLTNTNHRELGKFITYDSKSVMLKTEPRGLFTVDMPTDSANRNPEDSTHSAIVRQSQVIKTDMVKLFIKDLRNFASKLKMSTKIGVPLEIVGENCVRNTYVEATHTIGNVTVQRSNQEIEVEKDVLQDKIEAMVKEMVNKSGWSTIKYAGSTGYIVQVLAHEDLYLGNFTLRDGGQSVKVTKSNYLNKNEIYVTLEAIGGPSVAGVKLLQIASTVMRVPTTYAGTRVDGDADYKTISTSPEYNFEFKLGVLGKITLQ